MIRIEISGAVYFQKSVHNLLWQSDGKIVKDEDEV